MPELLSPEVISAVRRLERRGKLTARRAAAAVQDLLALPVRVARNAHAVIGRLEATTLIEFERRLLVYLGFGG